MSTIQPLISFGIGEFCLKKQIVHPNVKNDTQVLTVRIVSMSVFKYEMFDDRSQ